MTDQDHACPATSVETVRKVMAAASAATDHTARLACEFGFKASERGWNLQRTMAEFDKLMGS